MWVVVAFTTDDVAAVPFSWILRKNDKIMCFWPLDNPRYKIKKDVRPPESPDEYWDLHECRLLFDEAKFKTYKLANQKEIDGQKHSNLESQEESDFVRVNTRKHPRTNFSCDSDDYSSENSGKPPKRSKQCDKRPKQCDKRPRQAAKCTREISSASDEASDDNQYVFIKNVQKDLPKGTVSMFESEEFNETSTSAGDNQKEIDSVIASIGLEMTLDTSERGSLLESVDEVETSDATPMTSDEVILEQEVEYNQNLTEEDISGQINAPTANNPILLETIDLSEDVIGKVLQKLSEILQNQNDFKKVLVNLTHKVMKLEHQIKKFNNAPSTSIVRELGLPIIDKQKYIEVQIALDDHDDYEKLVNFASSLQEPSVTEFIKRFMKIIFGLEFLYKNIVWRTDANKILIKDTKIACCLFAAIKIKFSELKEKQMEDAAVVATRQIRDCFRKKK